ncbi:MAG: shikimate dehydrogenase [Pseudomonadota bacterium]
MKVYCVIGDNRVAKSLSPTMHNSIFAERSPESKYVAFSVEQRNLREAVNGIKAFGIAGANVTVPHKEAITHFLDGLSSEAEYIGAVNTIVPDGDTLIGHNTDVGGFNDLLEFANFCSEGSNILVLGAGSATRAVLSSLIGQGSHKVFVANRTYEKCLVLTQRIGGMAVSIEDALDISHDIDLLVNTTSVSSFQEASGETAIMKMATETLPKLKMIIDINYGRDTNVWSDMATLNKARFLDGLYLLAAQGRRSYSLWSGETFPIDDYLRPLGF